MNKRLERFLDILAAIAIITGVVGILWLACSSTPKAPFVVP